MKSLLTPANNHLYLLQAGYSSTTLLIVDATSHKIVKTVPFTDYPFHLTLNRLTNRLYVSGSKLYVIDCATDTLLTTIANVPSGGPIVVNPNTNRIYVADSQSTNHVITVLDGVTDAVVTSLPLTSRVAGIDLNPRTNTLYAVSNDDGTTTVVDGATNTITTVINVGGALGIIAVNPSTNQVYTAVTNTGATAVIDGATNVVTGSIPEQINAIAVNPDINRIYTTGSNSGYLDILDGRTNDWITSVPFNPFVTGRYLGMTVDPATNRLFITGVDSDTIWTVQDKGRARTYISVFPRVGRLNRNVLLLARLRTGNAVIPGKTLTFKVGGIVVGTAVTDGNGLASVNYTLPPNLGTGKKTLLMEFAGDSALASSHQSGTLTVNP